MHPKIIIFNCSQNTSTHKRITLRPMSFTYQGDKAYPSLGKWLLINILGEGATSSVFLGYDLKAHVYSALKVFKDSNSFTINEAKKEAQIQSSLKHHLLLQMKEFNETAELTDLSGARRSVCYLELELARGGDLLLLSERVKVIPEKLARTYLHQIIEVLEYLHDNRIAHRDIKLENLMLDSQFCIKLTDFGCASKYSTYGRLFTVAGTSKYFSPERNLHKPYDAASADIFAAAVVIFCLVCGGMPFKRASENDYFYYLIINGKLDLFWKAHNEVTEKKGLAIFPTPEFKELMEGMLDPNPSKRFSFEEIKKATWYQQSTYESEEVKKLVLQMIN